MALSITSPTTAQFLEPSLVLRYTDTLEVLPSTIPGAGDGLFAKVNITNGAMLGVYEGFSYDALDSSFRLKRQTKYMLNIKKYVIEGILDKDYYIEGMYAGNELRYINNDPANVNVYLNNDAEVHAIADISAGDELFLNYSNVGV